MRSITANALDFGCAGRNISCVRNAEILISRKNVSSRPFWAIWGKSKPEGNLPSRRSQSRSHTAHIQSTQDSLRCTYHYCYLLGRIEKRQYPPRMTPHLRKEIMKADIYKARLKFLQEQNICTPDDLTACIQNAEQQIAKLSKQRTVLNVRKKKRKTLYDALAAEAAFAGFEPRESRI